MTTAFRYKLVYFDNDNTAQRTEMVAFRVVANVLRWYLDANNRQDVVTDPLALQKQYAGDQMPEICRDFFTKNNVTFDEGSIASLAQANKEQTIPAMEQHSEPTDGMIQTAQALGNQGRQLALVTSSESRRVQGGLRKTGLDQFFTGLNFEGGNIYTVPDSLPKAGLKATPKPHPAICNLAARQTAVPKRHSVAVEDSATGVKAWVAAGIAVIGYTGADPLTDEEREVLTQKLLAAGAVTVIHHMSELPKTIESLEKGELRKARVTAELASRARQRVA